MYYLSENEHSSYEYIALIQRERDRERERERERESLIHLTCSHKILLCVKYILRGPNCISFTEDRFSLSKRCRPSLNVAFYLGLHCFPKYSFWAVYDHSIMRHFFL